MLAKFSQEWPQQHQREDGIDRHAQRTRQQGPEISVADLKADFRARLLATPAADPSSPVRLPGQSEMQNRHRQLRDGVDIELADVEKLHELSERRSTVGGIQ